MDDPEVTDILINGWEHISFEKNGRLFPFDGSFLAPSHLLLGHGHWPVTRHEVEADLWVNLVNEGLGARCSAKELIDFPDLGEMAQAWMEMRLP